MTYTVVLPGHGDTFDWIAKQYDKLPGVTKIITLGEPKPIEWPTDGIIIAHWWKSIQASLYNTQLPIFAMHHSFGSYDSLHRRNTAKFYQKRLIITGDSAAVVRDIKTHMPEWPDKQLGLVHNFMDIDYIASKMLSRKEAREALQLPQDAYVIGNIGRMHPENGQQLLSTAFWHLVQDTKQSERLRAVFIGDGWNLKTLKDSAIYNRLRNQMSFLGRLPMSWKYMRAFDLYVHTPLHAPAGIVLLDAMIAQVPIVYSSQGGAPELVQSYGWSFESGSWNSLYARLLRELKYNILSEKMANSLAYTKYCFSPDKAHEVFATLSQRFRRI